MRPLSRNSFSIPFVALAVFCSSASTVSAFSFSDIVQTRVGTTTSTALGLTATTKNVAEDDATYIYNKAREFAYRDEFGLAQNNEYDQHYHPLSDEVAEIEECKYWLREIVQVQSGCAAGTLAGKDLCENQDETAEIVARLRRKIEAHEKRVAILTKESESLVPTIATELIFGALLVVLVMFWTTLDIGQKHDDIPTMSNYREWMSILQEKGYTLTLFPGGGSPSM